MGRLGQLIERGAVMDRRLFRIYCVAIEQIEFTERVRLMAAAVTATEMQMRNFAQRIAEYLLVLIILWLGRNPGSVSVGISQISLRHYETLTGTRGLRALILSASPRQNLKLCCAFIARNNCVSLDEVVESYNGSSTDYYRATLERNFLKLTNLHKRGAS